MRIAITGHRPHKLGYDYDLTSNLIQQIDMAICNELMNICTYYPANPITCISGMAVGIDTLFAEIAIRLDFKLIAAIPCLFQDSKWPKKAQDRYHKILQSYTGRLEDGRKAAVEIVWITKEPYTNSCMQERNEWMVDNCGKLIAVWDGSNGGTGNCVKYAEGVGREIIRINPQMYK